MSKNWHHFLEGQRKPQPAMLIQLQIPRAWLVVLPYPQTLAGTYQTACG